MAADTVSPRLAQPQIGALCMHWQPTCAAVCGHSRPGRLPARGYQGVWHSSGCQQQSCHAAVILMPTAARPGQWQDLVWCN